MAKAKYSKGKDGYFRAKVWDGTYNPDGSKHRINLISKKSSADLEKKVNELKDKVYKREYVTSSDISLYDYAIEWLDTYKVNRSRNNIPYVQKHHRQAYNRLVRYPFTAPYSRKITKLNK